MSQVTPLDKLGGGLALTVVLATAGFATARVSARANVGCCASHTTHCEVIDGNYIYCDDGDTGTSQCYPMYNFCCTAVGDLCL